MALHEQSERFYLQEAKGASPSKNRFCSSIALLISCLPSPVQTVLLPCFTGPRPAPSPYTPAVCSWQHSPPHPPALARSVPSAQNALPSCCHRATSTRPLRLLVTLPGTAPLGLSFVPCSVLSSTPLRTGMMLHCKYLSTGLSFPEPRSLSRKGETPYPSPSPAPALGTNSCVRC